MSKHLLLGVLLLLAACQEATPPPLRLGMVAWPGYEPLALAEERHLFGTTAIHLSRMHTNSETSKALRSRLLDVAALTLVEAIMLLEHIPDLRVFLVCDISLGGDALIGQPILDSLAQLRGKRIGMDPASVNILLLARALEQAGLQLDEVELVWLEANEYEKFFLELAVDAVVTYEPFKTRLLAKGGSLLFDSTRTPGEIVDVLVARQEVLETRRADIESLVAGWFRALNAMQRTPLESKTRLAALEHLSVEEFDLAWQSLHVPNLQENRQLLGGPDSVLPGTATTLAKLLEQIRVLYRTPEMRQLFTTDYLPH
jgi:NitT/TauT family transport system substrate-binding protein